MRFFAGLLLCLLLCSPAAAQDSTWTTRLTLHGPSWHGTSDRYPWNNQTYGLGTEVTRGRKVEYGIIAGGYHNSVHGLSVYAGGILRGPTSWPVHPALGFGIVTGYDNIFSQDEVRNGYHVIAYYQVTTWKIMPIVWPGVIVGDDVQLRIMSTPVPTPVAHVMLSIELF